MKDKINLVSDMAFDAVDVSGDGQLDKDELGKVLKDVAKSMKICAPNKAICVV